MSYREKLYNFMTHSDLNKRIIGSAIALILIGGLYVVGSAVANTIEDSNNRKQIAQDIQNVKDADPKEYVNFYSVEVTDTPIGDLPNITLCRKLPKGNVKIDAVRTFIRYDNGKEKQVLERAFSAAIEKSSTNIDCTNIDLIGQPQVVGKYYIDTNYCFTVEIHEKKIKKCDSYKSNDYEMNDDLWILKERLDALRKEYDRRLDGGAPTDPSTGQTNGLQTPSSNSSQSNAGGSTPSSGSNSSSSSNSGNSSNNGSGNGSQGSSSDNQQDNPFTLDLPVLPPIKIGEN